MQTNYVMLHLDNSKEDKVNTGFIKNHDRICNYLFDSEYDVYTGIAATWPDWRNHTSSALPVLFTTNKIINSQGKERM